MLQTKMQFEKMYDVVGALCQRSVTPEELNAFVLLSLDAIGKYPRQRLQQEVKSTFGDLCMVPNHMKVVIFFWTLNREESLRNLICSKSVKQMNYLPLPCRIQKQFFDGLQEVCDGHLQYTITDEAFLSKIQEVYKDAMTKSPPKHTIPDKCAPKKKRRVEKGLDLPPSCCD